MRKNRPLPFRNKPVYALIVDGECEFWYFQMMKRNERSLRIDLKPEILQKKKLSEQFERVKQSSNDYDMVFWIIDFDVIIKENAEAKKGKKTALQEFTEYSNKLKKYDNVKVIVNNPCLEFWILLHFDSTGKYFSNCEGVVKLLRKYLSDYEKTERYFTKHNNDIYLKLKSKLDFAIANSKKLAGFDFENTKSAFSEMFVFFEDKAILDS